MKGDGGVLEEKNDCWNYTGWVSMSERDSDGFRSRVCLGGCRDSDDVVEFALVEKLTDAVDRVFGGGASAEALVEKLTAVGFLVESHVGDLFSSREELEEWAKKRGREHGCVVVVQWSRPRSVDLGCNRGGEPKLTATIRRIGSIKKGCPFKLKGRHNRVGNFWKLEVVNETHNHDPFVFKEGHAYLRRMTDEMVDMVARLHADGLKTSEIGPLLRRQFPEACVIDKDIHNRIESWRRENTVGDTPMQVFESFLINNGFVYHTRENPATNRVEDVFFCHDTSHKMWRAFPHLLLFDNTYNTNMYKWPFVQYIGVTSTSKSFCIAHGVLLRERQTDFIWALEHLKGMLEDSIEPRVIVTGRDSALMNSCKQLFLNATRNLCRWHIRENIKKKWKGIYDSEAREDFALLWTVLCESPTFDEYEYNCLKLQEMLFIIGKEKVWDYIHDSWLLRDKEKFVSCWMADRLNFGESTTNRVESQHANLKRHLNGANNTLHALAAYTLELIEAQKIDIRATFEKSRITLKRDHNLQVFYRLHY
ncbi:protein FAR-RED IMPAIRED RESPONSE 1-like [Bidens hawaiensis]|uniref:protein FAR-RED IMPAIRED RESPONSE 1-like n=1 Tax=Bidens hawaiensis TaxID=980011 RepID=UPI00404A5CA0